MNGPMTNEELSERTTRCRRLTRLSRIRATYNQAITKLVAFLVRLHPADDWPKDDRAT
jgi:hypothetical protein